MGRQAEAAGELQAQQVLADPVPGALPDPGLQLLQVGVGAQVHGQVVPAEAPRGQHLHLGRLAPAEVDPQHLAPLVGLALVVAIGLGGAAIPGLARHLFEVVPVAQGDVIEFPQGQLLQVDPVHGASPGGIWGGPPTRFGAVVPPGEALDTAVGDHQPGLAGGQGCPIQAPDPAGGIAGVLLAKQGTGQHHQLLQLQGLAFEQ